MKKTIAMLLALTLILTLASCNAKELPNEGTTETTSCSCATEPSETSAEPDSMPEIVETPPIAPEVKFIGTDGEVFTPYEELMFITDIQLYSNGQHSRLDGDGYVSVQNHLPYILDQIPTVALDETSRLEISAREGVSCEEITAVDVYGENGDAFERLAEGLTFVEIMEKGQDEWKNKMLYLYFDAGFYDAEASYEKSVRNGYFMKVLFADRLWGVDVRFETSELGLTVPHAETVYTRRYHDFGDGSGTMTVSDGPLVFYKVSEYLPEIAAQIPKVKWSEDFRLMYTMDEGITYKGGETFSVYAEDFTVLAEKITREELIEKSKSDWQGMTVYIRFGGVFYHKLDEELTEDIDNMYFVKTVF